MTDAFELAILCPNLVDEKEKIILVIKMQRALRRGKMKKLKEHFNSS